MWSLVLVLIIYWICVFFIILFDAILSWTGKWLLTVFHTWHHREIQWVTKVTTLTQWQALSEFRYSHYFPNSNHSCIAVLITAISILVVAYYLYNDFLFLKLNLFFKETSKKWKTNIICHKKNVPRKIKSIKHSSIMKFSLDIMAWWYSWA